MLRKQFLHSYASALNLAWRPERGTTIAEFLVAVSLSSLIASMVVSMTLAHRNIYQKDTSRTLVNQNIRTALDIVGGEIRQSGELFPSSFPAVLVSDSGTTTPDTLTLRRNLLSQVLVGCDTKSAGSSYSLANLSRASATTPACTYANQTSNYTGWFNYVSGQSLLPKAFIFNQTTRNGEFIQLLGTSPANTFGGNNGTTLYMNFQSHTMLYAYSAEATSLYMMNEWKFQVNNGVLQIIENQDTANPKNIIDGISNMQISVLMQDGTTKSSFINTDTWTNISTIRVTLTGSESIPGHKTISRTVSGDFLPRNILSN